MDKDEILRRLSKEEQSDHIDRWKRIAERDTSISEVFLESGVASVAVYEPARNVNLAEILIEDLKSHNIDISGLIFSDEDCGLCEKYALPHVLLDELGARDDIDFIVVVTDENYFDVRMELQRQSHAEVALLFGLVNLVYFKYSYFRTLPVFCKKHAVKICVLEWPQVTDFDDVDLYDRVRDVIFSPAEFQKNPAMFRPLYNDIQEYSDEYINEIFQERPVIEKDGLYVHADCRSKYVNIIDGCRLTVGQPDNADLAVFITGGCMAWGVGADDRYTIASFLQNYVNNYYGSIKNSRCIVHNFGTWGATSRHNSEFILRDARPHKIEILVFRADLNYPKDGVGRVHRYIKKFMDEYGLAYINPTSVLKNVESQSGAYTDPGHTNHRGYRAVAGKIFDEFLKPILDAGIPEPGIEQGALWSGLTIEQRWRMLCQQDRALYEFFSANGITGAGIYCAGKCGEIDAQSLKELEICGLGVKYFIDDGISQPVNADFPETPVIRIKDLGGAEKIDIIVVVGSDAAIDARDRIKSISGAETVHFNDILSMVWDRYFFYGEIAKKIAQKRVYTCVLQWPDVSALGLLTADIDAATPDRLTLGNLDANYSRLAMNLYNDIPGFSMKYLKEIFSDEPKAAKGKYLNVIDGRRVTAGSEADFTRTVWLFGGDVAFGVGAEDRYTISSQLQEMVRSREEGQGTLQTRVINGGVQSASADERHVFDKQITLRIDDGSIRDGDVILWIMDRRYPLDDCDKSSRSYVQGYLRDFGMDIIDLTQALRIAQKSKRVYVDRKRVNHRGYKTVATKIYFDYVKSVLDGKISLPERPQKTPLVSDPELSSDQNAEFREYLGYLGRERVNAPGSKGAIVVNCNPFTNGHRYLMERASSEVDFLYVFVVEEDRSLFRFEDRFALVTEGLRDMRNVKALRSGQFIISTITFPGYFTKESAKEVAVDTSLDLSLFVKYIAPALDIETRFAGNEPLDPVTKQYNNAMRETLPRHGVRFVEYERVEIDGAPVSASRVRALLEERNFDAIKPLVPESTYRYLVKNFKEPH
ncbi:MAG: hypothetical protein LBQ58_12375 [Synergistaceae bacterium]|jgi:[citrate (pro-3S)-lyase] ligase|nr:hypothetical protein [Synergistaceae bacterium]